MTNKLPTLWSNPITNMERLSNIFDAFPFPDWPGQRGLMAVKMWETNEALWLEADLPGVYKDDVDVTVDGRQLRITAMRHESDAPVKDGNRECIKEAYYGRIERSLTLPNTVEVGTCSAELKRGILFLSFKKTPDAKSRKIEIK